MKENCNKKAFSLAEVVLSISVLAVGMVFVAGIFPAAIYYTTSSVEKATAAIVADEAFAKIKLYGVDTTFASILSAGICDFNDVALNGDPYDANEFIYPSDDTVAVRHRQYRWSAVCRAEDGVGYSNCPVKVTVFVSRTVGSNLDYHPDPISGPPSKFPVPVKISVIVSTLGGANELKITNINPIEKTFVTGGSTIMDDATGDIYRVLNRSSTDDTIITLDRSSNITLPGNVWVVPPPIGGGRYPCVAVFQRIINF